jgi:hypothetical protein
LLGRDYHALHWKILKNNSDFSNDAPIAKASITPVAVNFAAKRTGVAMNTDWSSEELLLPASAAAGMLGISTDTLSRMSARGEGPPRIRVSRQWRYSLAGLRQWKALAERNDPGRASYAAW